MKYAKEGLKDLNSPPGPKPCPTIRPLSKD